VGLGAVLGGCDEHAWCSGGMVEVCGRGEA